MNTHAFPPLALACLKGDQKSVEDLLSKGADVNAVTSRGNTAAMIAFSRGHFGIVKLLMNAPGFDFFAKNNYGRSFPVIIASNSDLLNLLLQFNSNNPQIQSVYLVILSACCGYNNLNAIQTLLSCQVVSADLKVIRSYMAYYLLKNGNSDSLRFLVDLSKSYTVDWSNLHLLAAQSGLFGYFDIFPAKQSIYPIITRTALRGCHQNLLNHLKDAKPDIFNDVLINALRIVCRRAVPSNIQFLFNLAKKQFPSDDQLFISLAQKLIATNQLDTFNNIFDYKKGAKAFKAAVPDFIVTAAKFNRLDVLKVLLSANPQMNLTNAISSAVVNGHTEVVKYLTPLATMTSDDQAIIFADSIRSKAENCITLLLECGLKTSNPGALLIIAAKCSSPEKFYNILCVYLKHFSAISVFDSVDQEGNCLLHLIASKNYAKSIKLLRETDAELFQKDFTTNLNQEGKTPCQVLLRSVAYKGSSTRNRIFRHFLKNLSIPKEDLNFAIEIAKERRNKRSIFYLNKCKAE